MLKPALTLAITATLLSGCVRYNIRSDGVSQAALGQTVRIGPHSVTPLAVVEDSRCPTGVQCPWAGRVRVNARVDGQPRELTLGQPGPVELAWVAPAKRANEEIYSEQYRFGFRAAK